MRNWLGGIVAIILSLGASRGTAAGQVDCGPKPAVACLSTAIFSLAKTLPDDNESRRYVGFAERELAPGDIKTALEYIVADIPDPSPWEDVAWIAQAGRFDRAIERAKQRSSPVERLGGLLTVARHMLDRNDRAIELAKQGSSPVESLGRLLAAATHMLDSDDTPSDTVRATKIVEEVERELPSITADNGDDYASLLPSIAAEIWVRLGQTERAARLIGNSGAGSVSALLEIAGKYPAAASLREQAWREAERLDDLWVWQLVLKDAMSRGDKADVSRAAQGISHGIDAEIDSDHVYAAISLAGVLLKAGFPDLSARLAKQWTRWVNGKDARTEFNIVSLLTPVFAGLALDRDVQSAADAMSDAFDRSRYLSKAAEEYLRIGRNDIARKLDAEALRVATSAPAGEPKLQTQHDSVLHNLALVRADHGDIQGALALAGQLPDERRVREVTGYIVIRAIHHGHGPAAGPAILAMERQARAAHDASILLRAADHWYEIGKEKEARRSLAEALKTAGERQSTIAGGAAALMWRMDGNGDAEAMLEIVDRLHVNDPADIGRLVEIIRPVSPAVAVQLTGRQVNVETRIRELADVAIQIAEAESKK
jgi:tetratricopeptide (TPR) repeat protein